MDSNNTYSVRLLCAKSRIAPLKALTLPRLELCGAVLLIQLVHKVTSTLGLKFNATHYWTDSQIVLSWIRSPSRTWKTFVSNRVSEIQQYSDTHQWKHVGSKDNPADLISRGATPQQLIESKLWFDGPPWLYQSKEHWPNQLIVNKNQFSNVQLEARKIPNNIFITITDNSLFSRFSSFNKLRKSIAYIFRFYHNCKNHNSRRSGVLTVTELHNAHDVIIKLVQTETFSLDIEHLKNKACVKQSSNLALLNPFIDNNGLLRVGGRLRHSTSINLQQKHPLLLPKSHHVTKSLIKTYICIFKCFTTKACHLELVLGLSTEAFLGALKRFIARRGKPSEIHCDNGTNFVGACNELDELKNLLNSSDYQNSIKSFTATEGINWKFIPPRSPHFGGLWESAVKAVKFHLKRIAGNANLTFEEMFTLVAQIESCINSRPLTPMSNDPNDLNPLTPAHFLVGDSLQAVPEPDITNLNVHTLSHWQRVQQCTQHFWKRWSSEYLQQLQQRVKWKDSHHNLAINELVLIKDDNLPPLQWKLGRVIEVFPGSDKVVRVVKLKTSSGIITRVSAKLCPLPMINQDS